MLTKSQVQQELQTIDINLTIKVTKVKILWEWKCIWNYLTSMEIP